MSGNPDRIDVGRTHLQDMAFGYGHHFCAEAQLARLEAIVGPEMLLARFRRIELISPEPLAYRENANVRCVEKLPLRVEA